MSWMLSVILELIYFRCCFATWEINTKKTLVCIQEMAILFHSINYSLSYLCHHISTRRGTGINLASFFFIIVSAFHQPMWWVSTCRGGWVGWWFRFPQGTSYKGVYKLLSAGCVYPNWVLNSLAPGRSEYDSKNLIFNLVLLIVIFRASDDNALRWMLQDLTDEKSTLVQVMAWCHQAASHYLSQCWPRYLSPCGVPRPQWVMWCVGWRCDFPWKCIIFIAYRMQRPKLAELSETKRPKYNVYGIDFSLQKQKLKHMEIFWNICQWEDFLQKLIQSSLLNFLFEK